MPAPALLGAVGGGIAGATTHLFLRKVAFGALSGLIQHKLNKPKSLDNNPTYRLSPAANLVAPNTPVPVIYGNVPVAGYLVYQSAVRKSGANDQVDKFLLLCEGEISSINNVEINEVALTSYPGCSYTGYLGTKTQMPDARTRGANTLYDAGAYVWSGGNPNGLTPYYDQPFTIGGNSDSAVNLVTYLRGSSQYEYDNYGRTQTGPLTISYAIQIFNSSGVLVHTTTRSADVYQGTEIPVWTSVTGLALGNYTARTVVTGATAPPNPYESSRTSYYDYWSGQVTVRGGATYIDAIVRAGPLHVNDTVELGMRHRAYIAATLTGSEQLSGNTTILCDVNGLLVKTWNGSVWSASKSYSNNPSAAIRDFLTSTKYGKGLPESLVDDPSWGDFYDYCDQTVTNPDGSTEKRYELDIGLTADVSWVDHLRDMMDNCGAFLIFSEGVYKIKYFADHTPSASFDEDNIIPNSISVTELGYDDWPNEITAQFPDRNDDWTVKQAKTTNLLEQNRRDYVDGFQLDLRGTTRVTQARRTLKFYELQIHHSKYFVEFETDQHAAGVEPGDVIQISYARFGFSSKKFFVLDVNETADGTIKIETREHLSSIYTNISTGQITDDVTVSSFLPNPLKPPNAPEGLQIQEFRYESNAASSAAGGGVPGLGLALQWAAPLDDDGFPDTQRVTHYVVQYQRVDEGVWVDAPQVMENGAQFHQSLITGLSEGDYKVRVAAATTRQILGEWETSATYTLAGKSIYPRDVENLTGFRTREYVQLSWSEAVDRDLQGYEIREVEAFDTGDLQGSWDNGTVLEGSYMGTEYKKAEYDSSQKAYMVRAKDTFGNLSPTITYVRPKVPSVLGRATYPFSFKSHGGFLLYGETLRDSQGNLPLSDGGSLTRIQPFFGRHGSGIAVSAPKEGISTDETYSGWWQFNQDYTDTYSIGADYTGAIGAQYGGRTSLNFTKVGGSHRIVLTSTTATVEFLGTAYEKTLSASDKATHHVKVRVGSNITSVKLELVNSSGGASLAEVTLDSTTQGWGRTPWFWLAVTYEATSGVTVEPKWTIEGDHTGDDAWIDITQPDLNDGDAPSLGSTGYDDSGTIADWTYDPRGVTLNDGMFSVDWWLFSTFSSTGHGGSGRDLFRWEDDSGYGLRLWIDDTDLKFTWSGPTGTETLTYSIDGEVVAADGLVGWGEGSWGETPWGSPYVQGATFGTYHNQTQICWTKNSNDEYELSLWFNGKLRASATTSVAPGSSIESNPVFLAGCDTTNETYLEGVIDNVLLIPWTPDPEEVKSYFHSSLPFTDASADKATVPSSYLAVALKEYTTVDEIIENGNVAQTYVISPTALVAPTLGPSGSLGARYWIEYSAFNAVKWNPYLLPSPGDTTATHNNAYGYEIAIVHNLGFNPEAVYLLDFDYVGNNPVTTAGMQLWKFTTSGPYQGQYATTWAQILRVNDPHDAVVDPNTTHFFHLAWSLATNSTPLLVDTRSLTVHLKLPTKEV